MPNNVIAAANARENHRTSPENATDHSERLIARDELLAKVPYTIQHIYRLEKAGKFPRRVRIGSNRVAWVLSEIDAFITAKMAERAALSRTSVEG